MTLGDDERDPTVVGADAPLEKLVGKELKRVAAGDTSATVQVLIELAISQPEVLDGHSHDASDPAGDEVQAETKAQRTANRRTVRRAIRFLTELGAEPVWIPSARAMVATVTGAQLRDIARQTFVRHVHPNRWMST